MAAVNIQQLRKNYGVIPVLHGIDLAIADGQFVSLVAGIRPEHLTLAPLEGPTFTLPFAVDLIEPTGADSHVYGRTGDTQVVASLSRRDTLALGDQVTLRGRCEHVHVFKKASGLRID